MKNGWKGSAKGRLAFSPKLLLNNMQLQTWKAHPEESRMFHNLQRWRKGSTIAYKIWHASAVHSRDISGSINSSTLLLKLNLLDDDVRTYNDYVEDGWGGGGRKCLEEGGLLGCRKSVSCLECWLPMFGLWIHRVVYLLLVHFSLYVMPQ